MNIDQEISNLIQREGGYANNANDKGGETNMGITILKARAYGYTGPMALLPRSVAVQIYTEQYWTNPGFDKVAGIMPQLAANMFDAGVNMGPQTVSKFVQRALNVFNRQGRDYQDIVTDGQIGKLTLYVLNQFKLRRGDAAEVVMLRLFESEQAMRYLVIAETDPTQEDFMFGWVLNRVGDIK